MIITTIQCNGNGRNRKKTTKNGWEPGLKGRGNGRFRLPGLETNGSQLATDYKNSILASGFCASLAIR